MGAPLTCDFPVKGYRATDGSGRIVFNRTSGFVDREIQVPCGQCTGCRLEKSRQWAIRMHHEASLYDDNCFITLTYDDEHLPDDLSVDVRVFQKFMKRLRNANGANIRFYHCGEYGEKLNRPHYHAILFNYDFRDKKYFRLHNGMRYYTSEHLADLWPDGFSVIGDVTFESAAYCARYVTKKVTGYAADFHYCFQDKEGKWRWRNPEYSTMSRRPGIGTGWMNTYRADIWPGDFVVVRGVKMRPPRFYDKILEIEDLEEFRRVKRGRIVSGRSHADDNTPARRKVRAIVREARLSNLKRGYENEP